MCSWFGKIAEIYDFSLRLAQDGSRRPITGEDSTVNLIYLYSWSVGFILLQNTLFLVCNPKVLCPASTKTKLYVMLSENIVRKWTKVLRHQQEVTLWSPERTTRTK